MTLLSPPGYTWKQLKYREILHLVPFVKVTSSSTRPGHLLVLLVFHETLDYHGSDHWPVTEILKGPNFNCVAKKHWPTTQQAKMLRFPSHSQWQVVWHPIRSIYFISSCRKLRHWPPVNSQADRPWELPGGELFPLPPECLGNWTTFGWNCETWNNQGRGGLFNAYLLMNRELQLDILDSVCANLSTH